MSANKAEICAKHNLSEDMYDEFKAAFDMFDVDSSGDISASELHSILTQLGKKATKADAEEMIKVFDENGDGKIDFDEFVKMMLKENSAEETELELRKAFDVFDIDGNGKIDKHELSKIMTNLMGKPLSNEDIDAMLSEADTDQDGYVSFEEFKNLLGKV